MHQPVNELFRQQVLDHQDGRLDGSILMAMPPAWRAISFGLAGVLLASFAFLFFGTYTRVEVVEGALTLDSGIAVIVPSRAGVVDRVFVQDGMRVAKGLPLVSVRTEEDLGDGTTAPQRLRATLALQADRYESQEAFLAAASRAKVSELREQARGLSAELRNIDAQIVEQRALTGLSESNFKRAQEVASRGFISRRDLERIEEEGAVRRQQLSQLEQRSIAMKSDIAGIERSMAEAIASSAGQIEALRINRNSIEKERADVDQRQGYVMRAQLAGVVTATVARVGQEAKPGERLMLLVPEGATLQAELQLPSSAVGFVKRGQRVRLAIDAFPYDTFGTVGATVTEVSRAAYAVSTDTGPTQSYLVVAKLDRDYINAFGKREALLPGMMLTARIITQKRTLFQWLFEPLYAVGLR